MTKGQSDLLKFIRKFWEENDYCPSYADMCKAMGLKSKAGINRSIVALEERGYITRIPHKARSIQLVVMPQTRKAKNANH